MRGSGVESFEAQFRRISGRGQWIAWLFAMAVTAGVVIGGYLVAGTTDGMVAVIAGLFVLLLGKSFLDITFLDRESKLASEQARMLAEAGDIGVFLERSRASVFRAHIGALFTMMNTDSVIGQDKLIEIVHARLVSRNRTTELFASVLVTLGLIGTIIGLIQAIAGLDTLISADDADSGGIADGLLTAVGGLSTAFYTTLAGAVFGGVVLRVLSGVVSTNVTAYVAHLAELTEVHVLPSMRRVANGLERSGYYARLDDAQNAGGEGVA